MKAVNRIFAACALGFLAIPQLGAASPSAGGTAGFAVLDDSVGMLGKEASVPKSALAQTLGSRATATSTATVYGGFELRSSTLVYILVRGNSLGTLGVTQGYLDLPRVRVYNSLGQDIAVDLSGNAGFNFCLNSNVVAAPVWNYYTNVRGQPPADRDACTQGTLSAGTYTFSVTPSIPGLTTASSLLASVPPSGELLFEVTLNPL